MKLAMCMFGVIVSCAACFNQPIPLKSKYNPSVIVIKHLSVDDSMNLYLYKIDARSVSSESYISYRKDICDISGDDFIIKGFFNNFTVGKNDTILIWSEFNNCIDSIQNSKFYYKKMMLTDSLFLNFDDINKLYLSQICEKL